MVAGQGKIFSVMRRRLPPPRSSTTLMTGASSSATKADMPLSMYYEEEPGRQAAANLMTKDEPRRIAANIA